MSYEILDSKKSFSYYESDAQKDTMCDACNGELPKGIAVIVDDDTGRLYCGVECWEEDNVPDEEEDENA